MKITLLAILSVLSFAFFNQNANEFVCPPCGRECDNQIYYKEGTCSSCNMKLVEKSSIHFTNISVTDLCNRILTNPNAILLDVRSAGEFKGTTNEVATFWHFKTPININFTHLEGPLPILE